MVHTMLMDWKAYTRIGVGGYEEILCGDEYVRYLNWGTGFMEVYVCQNVSIYTFNVCSLFYVIIIQQNY